MIDQKSDRGHFGIIVSGGPAPGINCVINTAVIEATNRGYEVYGLVNGFRGLSQGEKDSIIPLTIERVSRIYNSGGSILGTSRFNPFVDPTARENFISGLKRQNIDKLIVIGGEGTAYLASQMTKYCPEIQVVAVPKTIDNDLILPNQYPSFGFETARYVGTGIIDTLMVDAKTTKRWFLVTSMGRKAGFLALGLGIASGATLTIIPEEFAGRRPGPDEIARIIFGSIQKRAAIGKQYGVAIVAEGVLDCIDPEKSPALRNCPRDDLGRINYAAVELGDVLLPPLKDMCKCAGIDLKIIQKNIGYELRCHAPVSFDIEYTKFLGYGAVKQILDGRSGIMVTRDFDTIGFEPLQALIKPDGTIRSRTVNLNSDLYKGARSFMIR
jgi:6-phosphofructokinase 1